MNVENQVVLAAMRQLQQEMANIPNQLNQAVERSVARYLGPLMMLADRLELISLRLEENLDIIIARQNATNPSTYVEQDDSSNHWTRADYESANLETEKAAVAETSSEVQKPRPTATTPLPEGLIFEDIPVVPASVLNDHHKKEEMAKADRKCKTKELAAIDVSIPIRGTAAQSESVENEHAKGDVVGGQKAVGLLAVGDDSADKVVKRREVVDEWSSDLLHKAVEYQATVICEDESHHTWGVAKLEEGIRHESSTDRRDQVSLPKGDTTASRIAAQVADSRPQFDAEKPSESLDINRMQWTTVAQSNANTTPDGVDRPDRCRNRFFEELENN